MKEAKQMTTAQAVGAASHTPGGFSTAVRIGSKPVSSRPDSFLIRPRPRVSGGRFWVLEPDDGKPSSPVLRGLGASNGARPLNMWHIRIASCRRFRPGYALLGTSWRAESDSMSRE